MVKAPKRHFGVTSIKDIAREASVAISTVSNVINDTRFVSEKTRIKVLEAIDKLDYRPNIIARGLRIKSTRAIGVILPDISSSFFSQVINGVEEIARERNYTMIIGCTQFDGREEIKIANRLIDSFIDGLLFFSGFDNHDFIKMINDKNIPVVAIDKELNDEDIPTVVIDNAAAMEKCVDYLCSYNHKKICYVSFPGDRQTTIMQRYEGYISGLKKNKITFDPDLVLGNERMWLNETVSSYILVKEFLKKGKLPTAFLAAADVFAYGVLRALHEEGIKVPDDVSVMGFDNILFSQFTRPLLTTLKQQKKLMGNIGMNLLADIIEKKEIQQKIIKVPTSIVERESVSFARSD